MTSDLYKENYKTAESRALYIIAKKKFGSFIKMGKALGVSRQYINQCVDLGIPLKYASYLGRALGFDPGILAYKEWCLLLCKGDAGWTYEKMVKNCRMFDSSDVEYILEGVYETSAAILKEVDKEIGG